MTKKFAFTREELKWLRKNFRNYTGRELFDHIMGNRSEAERAEFTTFRTELYRKNLKKCRILRWTKAETQFLLDNKGTMGNREIAKRLSTKTRKITKKNVEKKIKLLGVNRTKEELDFIRDGHKKRGVYSRGNLRKWSTKKLPEGGKKITVRHNAPIVMIKINGLLVRYARYRYIQLHGEIPRTMHVHHKDMNPLNVDDENLIASGKGLNKEDRILFQKNAKAYFDKQENEPEEIVQEVKDDKTARKIPVRINSRTIVYVTPGTNLRKLRKQYEYQNVS